MFHKIGARPAPEGNQTDQIGKSVNQESTCIRCKRNLSEMIDINHAISPKDS